MGDSSKKPQKGAHSNSAKARPGFTFVMERFGRIGELDRSFDLAYWRRQDDAAVYRAAWELVEMHHRAMGRDPHELRLQRSVETFQRR
jgi:hypothetical protein